MRDYDFKKFLADLAILGLTSIIVSSLIYLAVIFILLNAISFS